jgi:phasin
MMPMSPSFTVAPRDCDLRSPPVPLQAQHQPKVRTMNVHEARRFAEKTAATARDTPHKSTAAAEEMTQAATQGYFAAAEAVRDFNAKLIEIAQANTMAAVNFAQEVATAKSPIEAAMLWSSHARKNFETLTDQSKQLTALGQRVMTSAAEPLSHSFTRNLQGSV